MSNLLRINNEKKIKPISKINKYISQKIANLKIALQQKNNTIPLMQKGNVKFSLDDAIRQIADNGKKDSIKQEVAVVKPLLPQSVTQAAAVLPLQTAVDVVTQLSPSQNVIISNNDVTTC